MPYATGLMIMAETDKVADIVQVTGFILSSMPVGEYDREVCEEGGVLRGYQLTYIPESLKKVGKQCG